MNDPKGKINYLIANIENTKYRRVNLKSELEVPIELLTIPVFDLNF